MNTQSIIQLGNHLTLNYRLNISNLMAELEPHDAKWSQYNTKKLYNHRDGLCVFNERGVTGPGPALNSLLEWNRDHGTSFTENEFNKPTEVFNTSMELQQLLSPIQNYVYRTHFLKLHPGGFFPPHRDSFSRTMNSTIRLIVPIMNCQPPHVRFILEDKTLTWEEGRMYFVNTILMHMLFNASHQPSTWLVINAECNDCTYDYITSGLSYI